MQIAGSAGIRFRMEMVMSSSSDASAQRRRHIVEAEAVRRLSYVHLPDWVLAAAGSSVVRAAGLATVFCGKRGDLPVRKRWLKHEYKDFNLAKSGEGCFTLSLQLA